jgi:hypothetical protein
MHRTEPFSNTAVRLQHAGDTCEALTTPVTNLGYQTGTNSLKAPPAKPQITRDGTLVKDAVTGKIAYTQIIELTSRDARDRFSAAVVAAAMARDPTAFDEAAS